MVKIMAIANQKGGVGKTTTCVNLSASLAAMQKRVLLVDADPQGNTTMASGVNKFSLKRSLAQALIDGADPHICINKKTSGSYHLLGSSEELSIAEVKLFEYRSREFRLRNILSELSDEYDYIFIDCPPTLNLLTVNALCASDGVIVPLQCEYFALEGLTLLIDTVDQLSKAVNPKLRIAGILRTMFDSRNRLANDVSYELKRNFGSLVYKSIIPKDAQLAEAPSFGQPAMYYAQHAIGTKAYLALAGEIVERDLLIEAQEHKINQHNTISQEIQKEKPIQDTQVQDLNTIALKSDNLKLNLDHINDGESFSDIDTDSIYRMLQEEDESSDLNKGMLSAEARHRGSMLMEKDIALNIKSASENSLDEQEIEIINKAQELKAQEKQDKDDIFSAFINPQYLQDKDNTQAQEQDVSNNGLDLQNLNTNFEYQFNSGEDSTQNSTEEKIEVENKEAVEQIKIEELSYVYEYNNNNNNDDEGESNISASSQEIEVEQAQAQEQEQEQEQEQAHVANIAHEVSEEQVSESAEMNSGVESYYTLQDLVPVTKTELSYLSDHIQNMEAAAAAIAATSAAAEEMLASMVMDVEPDQEFMSALETASDNDFGELLDVDEIQDEQDDADIVAAANKAIARAQASILEHRQQNI